MFNVDRWETYTRQNYSRRLPGNRVITSYILVTMFDNWSKCTPKQNRRMRKKMRKGDTSIGMY